MILEVVIIALVAILISSVRVTLGPTAPDRIVGIEAIIALMVAVLVLLGAFYRAPIFLDVALVYAFLTFLGTLAIAKYLEGRGIES